MIKSKKLSSLVAASLILTGGSFLGVQTVSADDSTRLAAVEALASQNHDSISELKETVKNISTTPEQLQQIAANKTDIAANTDAINKEVQDRTKAVADEAKARGDKDTEHDTAIAANTKAIEDEATARDKADQQEAQTRAAEDTRLDTKMDKGFATIQGQQDEQDAKIGKNQKDIQTNAGNIQKNKDAIKVNSDKIANHEERITTNESNIEHNAEAIKNETNARIDADQQEAQARAAKDTEHDAAIKANTDNITKIQDDLKASNLDEMSKTAASLKSYDTQMSTVQALAAGNKDNIDKNKKAIEDEATARDKADQQEAQTRAAEDTRLDTKMDKGFATIQGQQDEQDAKIGKNQKDIQTNAGNIQENKDAIKVNSDKLTNHEDRITTNESNIERNAESIKKETNARIDEDKKLQGNIDAEATARDAADKAEAKARADKDTAHDTAIAANKKAIEDEATARDAADKAEAKARADKDTAHDTAIAANKKAIGDEAAARQADVSRLDNKIHDVSKEVDTVGALSMAMSGLHPLSYDEGDARFQLSAAVGTYDGTEALALGGFYHFNRDSMLSVGVATDLGADEHRMGANVGYTRRIGQGGHVSRPSEGTVSDIMKDIKNLEQKQAKLEQENEQLKQQLAALKK